MKTCIYTFCVRYSELSLEDQRGCITVSADFAFILKYESSQTSQKPPKPTKNQPNHPKTSQTTQNHIQTNQNTQGNFENHLKVNLNKQKYFILIYYSHNSAHIITWVKQWLWAKHDSMQYPDHIMKFWHFDYNLPFFRTVATNKFSDYVTNSMLVPGGHSLIKRRAVKIVDKTVHFWLTDRPKDGLWVNAITFAEIAPVGCCLGEPTCNSSCVQGHTDEDILTIHHSSNQPFTAIKIPWHSCVEQVNIEISGLSALRLRLCMSLENQHAIGACNLCAAQSFFLDKK